jgi:sterol desaturase/sphingolipid hydroxylase (fatty acid hydroxylase superfamily)
MAEWSLSALVLEQVSVFVPSLLATVGAFVSMLVLARLMARRRGERREGPPPPELKVDFFWWLINPVGRVVSRIVILGIVMGAMYVAGKEFHPSIFDGFGPVMEQPRWLMLTELFILTDLTSYWSHRLCHTVPALWKFHAVHHSPKMVRWTSTARLHPVNELITYCANILPAMLLGFPAYALGIMIPVIATYAAYSHSKWHHSLGPFRFIFTGPLYHRWHHTHSNEGGNKNFSGVFAFWDFMFGTHYMPKGRVPEVFGLDNEEMPEDFMTQLMYPFRKRWSEQAEQAATKANGSSDERHSSVNPVSAAE